MQTKKHSLLESLTNVIVGLLMSFLTQLVIYPILNIEVSLNQNIIIMVKIDVLEFSKEVSLYGPF